MVIFQIMASGQEEVRKEIACLYWIRYLNLTQTGRKATNVEIILKARSSSRPEPYLVVFLWNNKTISVSCDCPAGELGQLCKHKLALLQNDASMLYDADQNDDLNKAFKWVQSTSFSSLLNELEETERQTEQTIAKAKKQLASIKQKVGRLLKEGLK